MRTRALAPLKLTKSPLVIVLGQVRISPVLQMETYIPQIQERLRHKGYPVFRPSKIQEFNILPDGKAQVASTDRWIFAEKDRRTAVVIAPDFVVLETSRYDVFDAFSDSFEVALREVGEVVGVALAERIGLRYIDLIRPAEGESLAEYLNAGLKGLSAAELETDGLLHRYEATGKTKAGQLVVRLFQTAQGVVLPPDLVPGDIELAQIQLAPNERVSILDIDHFSVTQRDYEPAKLMDDMWALHDASDKAFRAAVTPRALERWGKIDR